MPRARGRSSTSSSDTPSVRGTSRGWRAASTSRSSSTAYRWLRNVVSSSSRVGRARRAAGRGAGRRRGGRRGAAARRGPRGARAARRRPGRRRARRRPSRARRGAPPPRSGRRAARTCAGATGGGARRDPGLVHVLRVVAPAHPRVVGDEPLDGSGERGPHDVPDRVGLRGDPHVGRVGRPRSEGPHDLGGGVGRPGPRGAQARHDRRGLRLGRLVGELELELPEAGHRALGPEDGDVVVDDLADRRACRGVEAHGAPRRAEPGHGPDRGAPRQGDGPCRAPRSGRAGLPAEGVRRAVQAAVARAGAGKLHRHPSSLRCRSDAPARVRRRSSVS